MIAGRLNWRQPNGQLKHRAVRDVLLRLNQKGLIRLPQPAYELKTQMAGVFETFVEKARFTGASYKAANWIYLGQTRGKGRSGMRYYHHGVLKDVYVYPLVDLVSLRQTLAEAL